MTIKLEHQNKLERIRDYLGISHSVLDSKFNIAVHRAAVNRLNQIHGHYANITGGLDFMEKTASHLNITFEEVRSQEDIARLEDHYIKQNNEIGFGQLESELKKPDVDALLFRRQQKIGHFVAVLNLQDTENRAYWNRAHEISHRLIEPPQQELMFRHRADLASPVEDLVDLIAAEIAFYEPQFSPIVATYCDHLLSWDVVHDIQNMFAPTASKLAVVKAVLRYWKRPAFLIFAVLRTRKNKLNEQPFLRISIKGVNQDGRESNVFFIDNMRVPYSSPIYHTFSSNTPMENLEILSSWTTSKGHKLPNVEAFTSAIPYNNGVLALISPFL